ncbi:MAG: HAD hydrolase-like protein [Firmicutes bacterium]|nr:HAD hydrolase-like protein [Bacillota bacterium]
MVTSLDDDCDCKKPLPGLVERAVRDFGINVSESYVIGDMGAADMKLAETYGAKGILVLTGVGKGSVGEFRHTWAAPPAARQRPWGDRAIDVESSDAK